MYWWPVLCVVSAWHVFGPQNTGQALSLVPTIQPLTSLSNQSALNINQSRYFIDQSVANIYFVTQNTVIDNPLLIEKVNEKLGKVIVLTLKKT